MIQAKIHQRLQLSLKVLHRSLRLTYRQCHVNAPLSPPQGSSVETMEIAMEQESVRGRPLCSILEEEEVMRKYRDFNPVIEKQDL